MVARVIITVGGPGVATVSAHVAPVGMTELKEKAQKWKVEIWSIRIPTVAVKFRSDMRMAAEEVTLITTEPADSGLGFGILPVLEEISNEAPSTIDRDELERELCLFLRLVIWMITYFRSQYSPISLGLNSRMILGIVRTDLQS